MAKTITDAKYRKVTEFVVEQAEPRIKKIVDEINKVFKKDGVRCGVELKWFYDEADADSSSKDKA